jgi:enamine deaminase RidA (YjgF/YER057c/UK114 family)
MLGSVREITGSLDRVKRVVKVLGLVNCVDGFTAAPKVIDGFSNCMVEVFGNAGRHGRSAFGVTELPAGIPVEVEAIFELYPQ